MNNNIDWIGEFSADDQTQIHALRSGQIAAVCSRDAIGYADLCVDDIVLMLTGYEPVRGRDAFIEIETRLLSRIVVSRMEQHPIRIERSGDLAFEIGRQIFELAPTGDSPDGFKAARKYSHILKRTDSGWRFAMLMSNDSI